MSEYRESEICIGIRIGVTYSELRSHAVLITIGRATPDQEWPPTIDLSQDDSVSRRHAEIRRTRDGYTITDLKSTNGTWVNGRRIPSGETVALADGDRVAVGRLSLLTISIIGVLDAGPSSEI